MRLLGYQAYDMRNAGAVIHSHGMESCLVTMINPMSKEFRITHMEMIKGIQGHGYYDELVVPIIENTTDENELTDSLAKKPIQKQQMCLFEIMAYTFGVTHGSVLKLSNSHFGGSLSDYSNCHDPQRRSL